MARARRRDRHHRPDPARALGCRRPPRPRPRPPRHDVDRRRRLPRRRGRLRCRVLRHRAARSSEHGPAAAPDARARLACAGRCRHRPRLARRQPHRCVRRRRQQRLRTPAVERHRAHRRLCRLGWQPRGGGRARQLRARAAGPGALGRHGLLFVAGGGAPRVPEPAQRRVRPGAGRRGEPDPHARCAHRVHQGPHDGARRPLQDLRRSRRRLRPRRRRCRAGAAAPA